MVFGFGNNRELQTLTFESFIEALVIYYKSAQIIDIQNKDTNRNDYILNLPLEFQVVGEVRIFINPNLLGMSIPSFLYSNPVVIIKSKNLENQQPIKLCINDIGGRIEPFEILISKEVITNQPRQYQKLHITDGNAHILISQGKLNSKN